MQIECKFEYPMKESEFPDKAAYEVYKSRIRESSTKLMLSKFFIFHASGEGLTKHEYMRALLDEVQTLLK